MTAPALPRADRLMAAQAAPLPPLAEGLVRLALLVARWEDRRRSRQALARLDAHMLRDIGLGPDGAARECAKPFWQG